MSTKRAMPSLEEIREALYGVMSWAKSKGLPDAFVQKLPELARRDPLIVREICDELAELGFPITANELRAYWRA